MNEPTIGTIREDGYKFIRMNVHGNGKAYPLWLSPSAIQKQRDRVRAWRLNNLDYSRQLVREWREKKKKALNAPQNDSGGADQAGSRKLQESEQEVANCAKSRPANSSSCTPEYDSLDAVSPSSKNPVSTKMEPSGHGTGSGLVPLVPNKGIPLRGIYPVFLEPLGTTTGTDSVPFAKLELTAKKSENNKKKIVSKKIKK